MNEAVGLAAIQLLQISPDRLTKIRLLPKHVVVVSKWAKLGRSLGNSVEIYGHCCHCLRLLIEIRENSGDDLASPAATMNISHPSVHPVEAPPATDVAHDPRRVRMKDIQGMPGTVGGLALRFFQFAFAVGALCVMASTSDFPSVTAFRCNCPRETMEWNMLR
ncbi:hypothetical protein ACLOJK_011544 [Asimina triloba]